MTTVQLAGGTRPLVELSILLHAERLACSDLFRAETFSGKEGGVDSGERMFALGCQSCDSPDSSFKDCSRTVLTDSSFKDCTYRQQFQGLYLQPKLKQDRMWERDHFTHFQMCMLQRCILPQPYVRSELNV